MSEKELDNGVNNLINRLMNAVRDYSTNPEQAEAFIRTKVKAIYNAGKSMGRETALGDIFNGSEEC